MSKQQFNLIVAGGRDFTDCDLMVQEIMKLVWGPLKDFNVVIINGGARGADKTAQVAALRCNLECHTRPADWAKHGKAAGPIRNLEMRDVAHGLLAFWDGSSKGTAHMIEAMKLAGKNVRIVHYEGVSDEQ